MFSNSTNSLCPVPRFRSLLPIFCHATTRNAANTGNYAHFVFNTLDHDNSGIINFEVRRKRTDCRQRVEMTFNAATTASCAVVGLIKHLFSALFGNLPRSLYKLKCATKE